MILSTKQVFYIVLAIFLRQLDGKWLISENCLPGCLNFGGCSNYNIHWHMFSRTTELSQVVRAHSFNPST